MSLINKLLQDLEHRQAAAGNGVQIAETGVQSVFRPRRRGSWMVAAMLLLPVVAAAGLWVVMSGRFAPPPVKVVAVPVPAKAAPAIVPVQVAKAPEPEPAPVQVANAPEPAPAPVQVAKAPEPAPAPVQTAKAPEAAPAPVQVAKAPEPAPATVQGAKATEPVAAPAPVAKKPEPVAAPVAVAKAPAMVAAKAPDDAPAQPQKVALAKPVEPPAAPKSTAVAAVESPKPMPAKEPKPVRADAKVAALYPGVVKKPVNEPAAAAPAETPVAAERSVAKLTATAETRSLKTFTPRQLSDNLYKQAVMHAQRGQGKDARELLGKSLEAAPQNAPARQLLVGLLVEANLLPDAMNLLREGVKLTPDQSGMWMNLARLQLEFGDNSAATATLEQGLPSAAEDPQYNAFYAAMMQRAGRHEDALKHYVTALRSDPGMPNWLVGAGISMQALGRESDAAEAFQRAKDGGQLPPAFTTFVDQRLATLKR